MYLYIHVILYVCFDTGLRGLCQGLPDWNFVRAMQRRERRRIRRTRRSMTICWTWTYGVSRISPQLFFCRLIRCFFLGWFWWVCFVGVFFCFGSIWRLFCVDFCRFCCCCCCCFLFVCFVGFFPKFHCALVGCSSKQASCKNQTFGSLWIYAPRMPVANKGIVVGIPDPNKCFMSSWWYVWFLLLLLGGWTQSDKKSRWYRQCFKKGSKKSLSTCDFLQCEYLEFGWPN